MTIMDIIILVLWAVGLTAYIIYRRWDQIEAWYHKRWGKKSEDESGMSKDNLDLVLRTLKELNCDPHVEKDNKTTAVDYAFQNGHFRILLPHDSYAVSVAFLYFKEVPLSQIGLVRTLCNKYNIYSDVMHLVYSVDKGTVNVHMTGSVYLDPGNARRVLSLSMMEAFHWRDRFCVESDEAAKAAASKEDDDPELTRAENQQEIYMAREMELDNQKPHADWHDNPEDPMTLQRLITTTTTVSTFLPRNLIVVTNDGQQKVEADRISQYPLHQPLIADGKFVRDTALLRMSYYDKMRPREERQLIVSLNAEQEARQTLYYRATVTIIPQSLQRDVSLDSEANRVFSNSVLLGFDLDDNGKQQEEFRFLWDDMNHKLENGKHEPLTKEQEFMVSCKEMDTAWRAYRGRKLYLEGRFLEAAGLLGDAFLTIERQMTLGDYAEKETQQIFNVGKYLAQSLMQVHDYRGAVYYLDLLRPLQQVAIEQDYITSLIHCHDLRAELIVDNWLKAAETPQTSDDDDDEENSDSSLPEEFISFLKRSKSSILINKGKIDEAETLLKSLLDDRDSYDFALSQLAYLQKKKEKSAAQ